MGSVTKKDRKKGKQLCCIISASPSNLLPIIVYFPFFPGSLTYTKCILPSGCEFNLVNGRNKNFEERK